MKSLLIEGIQLKNGEFTSKAGQPFSIVYFDASTPNLYKYKSFLQQNGAKWFGNIKAWGWFVSKNDDAPDGKHVYRNTILPCVKQLNEMMKNDNVDNMGSEEDLIAQIDALIQQLGNGSDIQQVSGYNKMDENELKAKLNDFKMELLNTLGSPEFAENMKKLLNMRRQRGWSYSLLNTILIMIQFPNAKMVKAKTKWADPFNRVPVMGAKAIILFRPSTTPFSKTERDLITKEFLSRVGKQNIAELSAGEKDILKVKTSGRFNGHFQSYEAFDITETKQIEGKEEVISVDKLENHDDDVPWYDKNDTQSDTITKLGEAMKEIYKENGINYSEKTAEELDGARGYSKDDEIVIIQHDHISLDILNTMIHEFSHAIMHQKAMSSKDPFWTQFEQVCSREEREQQAELTSWIVLKYFNIDAPTNINYVGGWGLNQKNAVSVFDTIANTADWIINALVKHTSGIQSNTDMNESIQWLNENNYVSGEDVAKLVGMEGLYNRSKAMQNNEDNGDEQVVDDENVDTMVESVMYRFKQLIKG